MVTTSHASSPTTIIPVAEEKQNTPAAPANQEPTWKRNVRHAGMHACCFAAITIALRMLPRIATYPYSFVVITATFFDESMSKAGKRISNWILPDETWVPQPPQPQQEDDSQELSWIKTEQSARVHACALFLILGAVRTFPRVVSYPYAAVILTIAIFKEHVLITMEHIADWVKLLRGNTNTLGSLHGNNQP